MRKHEHINEILKQQIRYRYLGWTWFLLYAQSQNPSPPLLDLHQRFLNVILNTGRTPCTGLLTFVSCRIATWAYVFPLGKARPPDVLITSFTHVCPFTY